MGTSIKMFWMNVRHAMSWKGTMERRYKIAAFCLFCLAYLPLCWFFAIPYLAGPATLVLLFAAEHVRARYMRRLAARMAAKDPFSWDVKINQVKVGTISDADYALLRHRVFTDVRVYVAQGLNLLRVALNSFEYCYRSIPIGLFWIGVALAIFSPETISGVLAALQHATPSEIRQAVETGGELLAILMTVAVGFHWLFGLSRFGFINCFGEAVGTAIRRQIGVAVEGSMVLSRCNR